MRRYEIPENGPCSGKPAEAFPETEVPPYSLEEQVMRTSEAVERLASMFADAMAAISAAADKRG